MKISKDIGIVLNMRPEEFDLNTAYETIQNEGLYAWGTGGVTLLQEAEELLPDGNILGLIKITGKNKILYGTAINVSQEFREYLKPRKTYRKLKEEHKNYRPEHLKESKTRNVLFLSDLFILNSKLRANNIIKINGKPFSSGDRSNVFIDLKRSKISPIAVKGKEFDSFSDNPFVQLLENKEDNLTKVFSFLLKNYEDIAKEFLKLCKIDKKLNNLEIKLQKKIKKSKKINRPDITLEWQDDGYKIYVEVKLDSRVDKNQLMRYSSKGKVICITRSGEEEKVQKEVRDVTYRSWEDVRQIIEKISNNNQTQKMLIVKDFLEYLTYLGISAS